MGVECLSIRAYNQLQSLPRIFQISFYCKPLYAFASVFIVSFQKVIDKIEFVAGQEKFSKQVTR